MLSKLNQPAYLWLEYRSESVGIDLRPSHNVEFLVLIPSCTGAALTQISLKFDSVQWDFLFSATKQIQYALQKKKDKTRR